MRDKSLPNLAQLMEENVAYSQDVKALRAERDHWKRVCEETEDRAAEVRAQLASAQRVPEDAELDALDERLKKMNVLVTWDASLALATLRRRVAELEDFAQWRCDGLIVDASDLAAAKRELQAAIAKEPQDA